MIMRLVDKYRFRKSKYLNFLFDLSFLLPIVLKGNQSIICNHRRKTKKKDFTSLKHLFGYA